MTVSASTDNFDRVLSASNTSHALPLPSTCPVGATILAGVYNRTSGAAPTGCSDGTNGAYSLATERGGGTNNCQLYYFLNNGSSGAHTVTITYASAVQAQMFVGWISSDAGVLSLDGTATPAEFSVATSISSNSVTATGAGAIIGFFNPSNAQTDPNPNTDELIDEYEMLAGTSGLRIGVAFEAYAAAGTYEFSGVAIDQATGVFLVAAFKEPAGGSTAAIAAYYNMLRNS